MFVEYILYRHNHCDSKTKMHKPVPPCQVDGQAVPQMTKEQAPGSLSAQSSIPAKHMLCSVSFGKNMKQHETSYVFFFFKSAEQGMLTRRIRKKLHCSPHLDHLGRVIPRFSIFIPSIHCLRKNLSLELQVKRRDLQKKKMKAGHVLTSGDLGDMGQPWSTRLPKPKMFKGRLPLWENMSSMS